MFEITLRAAAQRERHNWIVRVAVGKCPRRSPQPAILPK